MMLADMGADVIRIDRIPTDNDTQAEIFKRNDPIIDRGRKSIALDLKNPSGKEAALRLIARADALFEGFRPGVMEKLGLDPDSCFARNQSLVYGRMTGWGQTGPLAHAVGHDINYIALSGALHAIGSKDQPPPVPLNLIGDYAGGGMMLAFGLLCALLDAKRSGKGQIVDAAMSDGSVTLMAMIYGLYTRGLWNNARETNFLDGAAPFYSTYECADGKFIAVGALEPQFYAKLLAGCEIDKRENSQQWQSAQWSEMRKTLADIFKNRTRDQWCALLEGTEACCSPVLDLDEAPHHPHNQHRKVFVEVEGIQQPAPTPRFSRTPGEIRHANVAVGAQTMDVLAAAGFSKKEQQALIETGCAYQSG
jgi:alpha-methylacyl-CoA racemase